MGKTIRKVFKLDTLSLHECTDGYYLYDYVIGMNIAMHAKTEQNAYIEALLWYQKDREKIIKKYNLLNSKVEHFLYQFDEED